MTAMRKLYLCGAGNSEGVRLAQQINARHPRWDHIVLLDDDPAKLGSERLGVPVVGRIDTLHDADPATSEAANLVARATRSRKEVRSRILSSGVPFVPLVSPDVDVTGVTLARDVIVYQNVTLGPEATLDDGVCVFMGAVVGHEARIGACAVIAPNAVLNARVVLGEGAYVGSNASILPEVTIGAWAIVGAGSAVMHDVPAGASAVGVPAEVYARKAEPAAPLEVAGTADVELEGLVSRLWGELLHLKTVGREQNFFDLGGTSLLAIICRERIRQETGCDLALTDMFTFPTVRALAWHLSRLGSPMGTDPSHERGRFRRASLLHAARIRR
jgi:sugar O-acyltransferase (sialic acid O-acetyltransferase NeuD family)